MNNYVLIIAGLINKKMRGGDFSSVRSHKELRVNIRFSQTRVSRLLVAMRVSRNRNQVGNQILIGGFSIILRGFLLGSPVDLLDTQKGSRRNHRHPLTPGSSLGLNVLKVFV